MSQATVLDFLKRYKESKQFEKKKWLTIKEIHDQMKDTRDASAISSMTTSIKKLRDSGMVLFKKIQPPESNRAVYHYQSK